MVRLHLKAFIIAVMNGIHSNLTIDIFKQSSVCKIVADDQGQIHFCNQAAEELLKLSQRKLQGLPITDLFLDGDLDDARIVDAIASSQTLHQRDARLFLISREWLTADINIGHFTSEDKDWVLLEIHIQDRNHFVGLDSSEYSQHLAANALIRGLGHEIKNPLGGLRGAAQLLSMEIGDSNLKEYTEVIIKESDRLTSLVDRMMTPHKPGTKSTCSIHEPLENALQVVCLEATDKLEIERNYDPSIPDFKMFSDGLQQAFLNLVQNAVQAMEGEGKVAIETRIVRRMLLGDKQQPLVVRINISDTGPGVPEGLKNRLFLPMVSGKSNGSGLGLGLAQSLVQQHDGMIEYRDDIEQTTFSVYIPLNLSETL